MVFGLGPVEIAVIVVVGCLLEVVLLWASTGIAEAPDSSWGKLIAISLPIFLVGFAATCGIAHAFGVLERPLSGESRWPLVQAIGLALLALLVFPAVIYPPTLAVSARRGMWVSALQWVLRLFMYIFVGALVMVFLALLQIWRGT